MPEIYVTLLTAIPINLLKRGNTDAWASPRTNEMSVSADGGQCIFKALQGILICSQHWELPCFPPSLSEDEHGKGTAHLCGRGSGTTWRNVTFSAAVSYPDAQLVCTYHKKLSSKGALSSLSSSCPHQFCVSSKCKLLAHTGRIRTTCSCLYTGVLNTQGSSSPEAFERSLMKNAFGKC